MNDTWVSRAPWFGIAAAITALLAVIIGGETPDFDASRADIISHYEDSSSAIAAVLIALTGLLYVFFAGTLRARLRAAESLSTLVMVGGALFGLGLAMFAGFEITLYDLANSDNQIDPGTLQAFNAFDNDFFFPAVLGLATFYFSTALAILATGALPRWWGWVTLVLAVLSIAGPLGFAAFVLTLPWTLVTAILLLMGAGSRETPVGTAPGAAP